MYLSNFCHTRAKLTIPDPLIIIPDDQLGPQVALYSTYPAYQLATRWNSFIAQYSWN